jgi:hypothetical protein
MKTKNQKSTWGIRNIPPQEKNAFVGKAKTKGMSVAEAMAEAIAMWQGKATTTRPIPLVGTYWTIRSFPVEVKDRFLKELNKIGFTSTEGVRACMSSWVQNNGVTKTVKDYSLR